MYWDIRTKTFKIPGSEALERALWHARRNMSWNAGRRVTRQQAIAEMYRKSGDNRTAFMERLDEYRGDADSAILFLDARIAVAGAQNG